MSKMVTQQTESIIANYVKRVLEEETGDQYILKTRAELVHPNGRSWFLHLPVGSSGWLDHAQQEGKSLVFESAVLYDADKVIEFEYRSALKADGLRSAIGKFHLREMRGKYARMLPKVVKFFDKAESTLSVVNENYDAKMKLVNDGGSGSVRFEIGIEKAQNEEGSVRKSIRAMKDFLKQILDWQDEQRARSVHMAQIRKTHRELLEATKKSE